MVFIQTIIYLLNFVFKYFRISVTSKYLKRLSRSTHTKESMLQCYFHRFATKCKFKKKVLLLNVKSNITVCHVAKPAIMHSQCHP